MYTLGEIPRKGAMLYGDKAAIIFEGTRITYRELDERVSRLANVLIGLGAKRGGRVSILADNSHKFMEVYLAVAKAGLSVTPLNTRLSDKELTHIVNDCEATAFFAGDGYEERSLGLKRELKNISHWISLDKKAEGFMFYEDLLKDVSAVDPMVEVNEDEMAVLMYTGGTTGLPKGVMLSHGNIIACSYAEVLSFSITSKDTLCYMLPLFHIAFWPVISHLMVGGTSVILRRADIGEILKAIEDYKCTFTVMLPTLLTWLLDDPRLEQFDLSSLRFIMYAGSPMPLEVLKKCIHKFGNIFNAGYGLTEAAPGVTNLLSEDHCLEGPKSKLLGSCGRPALFVDVMIVDDDDVPLKPGEIGEIVVRGKNIMKGYWKNPDLTATTLRGGWLHTGDVGMMDEDGYLFLSDRKADMIITGGENVYPKETEDALYEHPAVMECAVVSSPDERWGEKVKAVVVVKPDMPVTEEELINHCKTRLAGYKCPKGVEFWSELPKTPIGKILRRDIKKKFWEGCEQTIG